MCNYESIRNVMDGILSITQWEYGNRQLSRKGDIQCVQKQRWITCPHQTPKEEKGLWAFQQRPTTLYIFFKDSVERRETE